MKKSRKKMGANGWVKGGNEDYCGSGLEKARRLNMGVWPRFRG